MEVLEIQQLIEDGLPDAIVKVFSDDGRHFSASIVSLSFVGKTLVQQHRMVYDTLGDSFEGTLHALSLRTSIPQ